MYRFGGLETFGGQKSSGTTVGRDKGGSTGARRLSTLKTSVLEVLKMKDAEYSCTC